MSPLDLSAFVSRSRIETTVCGVYQIEHVPSGRRYTGSSRDIIRRLRGHRANLQKLGHPNSNIRALVQQDGPEAFVFYIVETCEPPLLWAYEQLYIDRWRARSLNRSFDARCPANDPRVLERIRLACLSRFNTPEYQRKQSEAQRRSWADATIRQRREASLRAINSTERIRIIRSHDARVQWARQKEQGQLSQQRTEARAAFGMRSKLFWANPEWRAKTIAAQCNGRKRL